MIVGQRVITNDGKIGKCIEYNLWSGKYVVEFETDGYKVRRNYELEELRVLENGNVCPQCGKEWHKTVFNNHIWLDCLKCGKKYEDFFKK